MKFGRVLTAMVTPFNEEGEVDFEKMTMLIEHLLSTGTEGLIVTGTTGESPTLKDEEKIAIYKHAVEIVRQRAPVIAGTGSYNTAHSIWLTKKATECGVDGIMLVSPYYNKPNQKGLYEHFSSIAQATPLPIMLYNIPGRSVVNMTSETIIKLSKIQNITSLKEANGDLNHISTIIEKTPEHFKVYSGDDNMTLPILSIGGEGVVSVASHVIGREMKQMIDMFFNGKVQEAAEQHRKLLPIMKGLFLAPSPAPVKMALKLKGIDVGQVRPPLVPLSMVEEQKLKELL